MALSDLLRDASRVAAGKYVRLDASAKKLVLTELLLQTAGARAAERAGLKSFHLQLATTLRFEAAASDGHVVTADLLPYALETHDAMARIRARVPGGIRIDHESTRRRATLAVLRALGFVDQKINEVEGLTYEGEEVSYERPIASMHLLSWLSIATGERSIPITVQPGALVLDLASVPRPSAAEVTAKVLRDVLGR